MKQILITIIALIGSLTIAAQNEDNLIVKEYDSGFHILYLGDQRTYDINDDGIPELKLETFMQPPYLACLFYTINDWMCCGYSQEEYPGVNNIFRDLTLPLNSNTIGWDIFFPSEYYSVHCDTLSFKCGLRYKEDENFYYGWMEAYLYSDWSSFCSLKIARTCYCTIPNHPLCVGQTSLNEGFEETETTAFATLHPNPTTGLVTITGKDLKQAEVLNTLGQQVATAQGKGETLQIGIANLPAGVYFVRVTDEEGRKCVRKVVKE